MIQVIANVKGSIGIGIVGKAYIREKRGERASEGFGIGLPAVSVLLYLVEYELMLGWTDDQSDERTSNIIPIRTSTANRPGHNREKG